MLLAPSAGRRIAYLDGERLHRALLAGIRRIADRQTYLNKINVFPVPDGDTGTNLAHTLAAVEEATRGAVNRHAGSLLGTVAEAALDGARGNSGAIFAQFLQGVAEVARSRAQLTPACFVRAVGEGARAAREALAQPAEGTVLTVIGDFADQLKAQGKSGAQDFLHLLEQGLATAQASLAKTQYQMPVLERAGVVDAGAQGFVDFLDGIHDFMRRGSLRALRGNSAAKAPGWGLRSRSGSEEDFEPAGLVPDELSRGAETPAYRFCTECMVSGEGIERQALRAALGALACDSLVVAGTREKLRVHCHVDNPAAVFLRCEAFGQVSRQKADDMYRQQRTFRAAAGVAVVTDSGADIPAAELERLNIHMVPLRVQVGGRDFLDKVTLAPEEFYGLLRESGDYPTTSQPPPGDFRRQFNFLAAHHQAVVCVSLSAALSGTFQAAHRAAERAEGEAITVLDTKNAAAGQGLLAMYAAECAQAGWSVERIVRALEEAIPVTRSFAVIRDLHFGVRGGRVPRWFQRLADVLRLTPVLANDQQGRLKLGGVLLGRYDLPRRLARRVARNLDRHRAYRVLVGHCDCEAEGQALRTAMAGALPHIHSTYLTAAGTAIGAHAGPGSLVVAVQAYEAPAP